MRRRGVRVFAVIAALVALSILTLSFKEIHISFIGANIDTNGSGPLGLTLGLDLQGGSHLMYQADLPDTIDVVFLDEVEAPQLRSLLDDLEHSSATIANKNYTIGNLATIGVPVTTGDLAATGDLPATGDLATGDDTLVFLRLVLENELAGIESFDAVDGILALSFRIAVEETSLRDVLEILGETDATIESPPQKAYTINNLDLDETARQVQLRQGLENAFTVDGYNQDVVKPTVLEMDGVVDKIRRRVSALGTSEPIVQSLGDDRVVVQLPGAGGSTIDVTFRGPLEIIAQMGLTLEKLGHTGDTVERTAENSFIVRLLKPLSQVDKGSLADFAEREAPGAVLEFRGDDDREIAVALPPQETLTISDILRDIGYTKFTVQRRSETGRFTIRTDDVLTTEDQDTILEALEMRVAGIVAFEVTGGIEEAKRLIGGTAQLEFRERDCEDPSCIRFTDRVIDGLTGENLDRAYTGRDSTTNQPLVNLEFNNRGRDIFRDLIPRLFNIAELGRLAIFLDDQEISAAVVRSPRVFIDGVGQISGGFTRDSARTLAIQLESGRLDVPLTLIRESSVDALLGADSLKKSLIAGFVGLGLVILFMLVYYRMAGLVAGTSLMVYAVIILAIFKLIPVNLTLSGIAGLVLSIGMAVDANILIFERMKEEMRTGRTLTSAMDVGFRRAWNAIRDSNVSTIITCLILWWFGSRMATPLITSFAITLLIGVIVSMFTALMVSRNMLQILALTPVGRKINLFTPEPRRQPVGVTGGGKRI